MRRQWKPGMHWRWNIDERRGARARRRFILWMDAFIEENNRRYSVLVEPPLRLVVNNG